MMNNGNNEIHMGDYSFMGMHPFWWVLVLVSLFVVVVLFSRSRKR